MNITGTYGFTSTLVTSLGIQRSNMEDLEQQLSTGLISQTFGGLGPNRALALSFQSQLDKANAYQTSIDLVNTRLSVMNTSVQRLSAIGSDMKTQFNQQSYNLLSSGKTDQQQAASNSLDEMLSIFGSNVGGPYVFGGKATDKSPVVDSATILNGTGQQAGLTQVMSERLQADLGTNGYGRLNVGAAAGIETIAEDGVHPFGMKLTGITSTLTGTTVTQPAGAPKSASVNFTTGLPNAGDTINFNFSLPDGSTKTITLVAGTANTPATGTFQVGTTAAATAANLDTALKAALTTVGQTDLTAASAVQAGANFFTTYQGQAPQRVAGPPFATATALVAGTPANTVSWYVGDQSATNPRLDATAQVDSQISVNYGVRANEPAFAYQVQQLAVITAFNASSGTATTKAAYLALSGRVQSNLANTPTTSQISSIQTDLAASYATANQAQTRHKTEIGTFQTMVSKFENTDQTTVIAQLSSMQTQMQASYQASAILLKMSLANYISG